MNKTLRYSLLSLLMLVCGMISAQTVVFEETFSKCAGKGGNDGTFASITGNKNLSDDYTDNAGWISDKATAAKECISVGQSKVAGSVTTPAIALNGNATLTFKAAAWAKDSQTLTLSIEGGSLDKETVTLEKGAFSEYTVAITGGTANTKITFKGTAASNRFFLDDVKVVNAGGDTPQPVEVAAPTFSLESGVYTSAQTLTLTPAEGTTVYYTLDGTAPTKESTLYTAPIAITTTTTVKAIAYDAAGNASKVVSETYTFPVACANIAAVKDLESGSLVALSLTDAQVVYVNVYTSGTEPNTKTNTEYYVRDASGAIDLYNTGLELALGKVVNGTAIFKYTVYNGLPELTSSNATNAEGLTITDGKEVVPTVITVADLVNEEHLCDLVVVKNVQFATKKSGTYTNNYVFDPSTSDSALVYNKFKVESFSVPTDSKNYDVVGILGCAKLSGNIVNELFPTKAAEESSATGISNVKANVETKETIYNIAGQRVAKLQKGLNIVNGRKVLVK